MGLFFGIPAEFPIDNDLFISCCEFLVVAWMSLPLTRTRLLSPNWSQAEARETSWRGLRGGACLAGLAGWQGRAGLTRVSGLAGLRGRKWELCQARGMTWTAIRTEVAS